MAFLLSLPSSPVLGLPTLKSNPLIHHLLPPQTPLPHLPLHDRRSSTNKQRRSNFTLLCASSPSITSKDVEAHGNSDDKFDWYSHWYPVAPVCDLDKRKPHAKRVLGLDVVVWWDREQEWWQVFDDRCPHRLAPLSEGRIDRWGRLQCVYHGWCFDGAGSCKLIPQAPLDGPPVHTYKKACAAVYPSVEQNKIVWFWPSTDPQYKDILTKERPPYIPQLDDPSFTSIMTTRDLSYGYEVLIENLMDPAHVPYAHYGLLSARGDTTDSTPARDREGGRPLDITIDELGKTGFTSRSEMGYSKFIAPCVHYSVNTFGSSNESASSQNTRMDTPAKSKQKQKSALLVFLCIPVSPGKSRLIFSFPRNFSIWVDQIIPRWIFHLRQNVVLDSDLYFLHVEEQKLAAIGLSNWFKACYVPTKSDAKVIAFRRWFKEYADNRVDWGTKFNGRLPPSPPKEQIMDRYWSHTVQCSSCSAALQGLKTVEVFLQVFSVVSIGILAATKQNTISTITRTSVVAVAALCFIASKWLSHFIYKNFYFHDYNHAFR